jgi:hypothetical protein
MTLAEFIEKVSSEPARRREIEVRVPSPELLRETQRGRRLLSELLADPRHTLERRTSRTGHLLGSPAPPDALADWQRRWPRHPLPADLRLIFDSSLSTVT